MKQNTMKPDSAGAASGRKTYIKPVVERVHLVIEEAVLVTGCKNDVVTNARGFPDPCSDGFQINCDDVGS